MPSDDLPYFLFPPWHVESGEEILEEEVPDGERVNIRRTPTNSGAASYRLCSVLHLEPEVLGLAQRMLNGRHLEDWNVEVKLLHVWKFLSSDAPPHRHLCDGEPIGWCQYAERKIVVGMHPDLSKANYEKTIAHLVGNVLAANSARSLANRLLKQHGLKGWKTIVWERLDGNTLGWCLPGEKAIFLNPYKLRRPRSSIRETILHEIAHALAWPSGPNGHGPKWQKKARELGVSEEDISWHANPAARSRATT
jgi:hypothetical protein